MTEIARISADEVEALQRLLEACTTYAEQVTGYPTGAADAVSMLLQLPEGLGADAKSVLVARGSEGLTGVVDLLMGHPDPSTATIGVLLVHPGDRGRGIGHGLLDAVLDIARTASATRIQLGVVDTVHPAPTGFLNSTGFSREGDATPYRYDRLESVVRHWSRRI